MLGQQNPVDLTVQEASLVEKMQCGVYGKSKWENHKTLGFQSKAMLPAVEIRPFEKWLLECD